MQGYKAVQLVDHGHGWPRLRAQNLAHEQVRSRVTRIQVGGIADTLYRLVVGSLRKPRCSEPDEHSNRMREQTRAATEDFLCRFGGMVQEQFRAPIENVCLFG